MDNIISMKNAMNQGNPEKANKETLQYMYNYIAQLKLKGYNFEDALKKALDNAVQNGYISPAEKDLYEKELIRKQQQLPNQEQVKKLIAEQLGILSDLSFGKIETNQKQ
ncbi:hypothetical protein [Candidatus Absconditicoccus praedator]|uniref:hypothetical protein n=1 Tax=Candidatus Absconditicoccus praedator TaxID=2735562 RepID=UPI001E47DED6|nr:hypothetical protein [Candidatus Absconditicoccus praedator]UFX83172.1 hypothetical protein HLG78_03495 [Candidatus Absconditicoccus praedator]